MQSLGGPLEFSHTEPSKESDMSNPISIRLASFALAAVVTLSVLVGIDTQALGRQADATQMSQSAASIQVAARAPLPRS